MDAWVDRDKCRDVRNLVLPSVACTATFLTVTLRMVGAKWTSKQVFALRGGT